MSNSSTERKKLLPKCTNCGVEESCLWHRIKHDLPDSSTDISVLCHDCNKKYQNSLITMDTLLEKSLKAQEKSKQSDKKTIPTQKLCKNIINKYKKQLKSGSNNVQPLPIETRKSKRISKPSKKHSGFAEVGVRAAKSHIKKSQSHQSLQFFQHKRGNTREKYSHKSRRTRVFKIYTSNKPISRKDVSRATVTTHSSLFYNGVYFQTGDVVSLIDSNDSKIYYAQIRGFIVDEYCEKSAYLTWLIPKPKSSDDPSIIPQTDNSDNREFDPAQYIVGPKEDISRKMEYLEFVCHAPFDYFGGRRNDFLSVANKTRQNKISGNSNYVTAKAPLKGFVLT